MKQFRKFLAVCMAVVMLAISCMSTSAMNGGGIVESEDYTIGVDISVWNIGGSSSMNYDSVDFSKMKADGCDFAILRIGFEGSATRTDTLDLAFIEYYNRAREAGMKLGVYFYALGTTYTEAADDAQWVINVIEENDMYFEYPIYYDVEDGAHYALNGVQLTNLCLGWCETLENAGYFPGVYGRDTILEKLSDSFRSKYDMWIRSIKTADGEQYDPATMNISDQASLWQYTMLQKFDGHVSPDLDGNVSYKDYEKIMYENGYNNCGSKTEDNLASGKDVYVSGKANEACNLTDGIASERSPEEYAEHWISVNAENEVTVDLMGNYDITKAQLHLYNGGKAEVYVSDDYETFESIGEISSDSFGWAALEAEASGRYVRFVFDGEASVNELEIYGSMNRETENLAYDASYEAPAAIRGYTASLNDGNAAQAFSGASDWYGMFYNALAKDMNCPEGYAHIVFDLGADYALSDVLVNVGSGNGVSKPDAMKVRVATEAEGSDAVADAPFVYLSAESDSDVYMASADLNGICGRYVCIEVNIDTTDNYWAIINEVEINGFADPITESALPVVPAAKRGDVDNDGYVTASDYLYLKRIYFGTLKMTALDAPETAKWRCDVEVNDKIEAMDYILLKRAYFGTYKIEQ